MFKWIRKKIKERKKVRTPQTTAAVNRPLTGLPEFDHVYEEIADPKTGQIRPQTVRVLPAARHHRPIMVQRSISFQDVTDINANRFTNGKYHTVLGPPHERMHSYPSVSSIGSDMSVPTISMQSLAPRGDVSLDCMPDKVINLQSQDNLVPPPRRHHNHRGAPLPFRSQVYLPRRASTFGEADAIITKKKVKFQGDGHKHEIYTAIGSDSGYGCSTASEEGEFGPRSGSNFDTYLSKMEQLVKLEMEVKQILKTIRGEDTEKSSSASNSPASDLQCYQQNNTALKQALLLQQHQLQLKLQQHQQRQQQQQQHQQQSHFSTLSPHSLDDFTPCSYRKYSDERYSPKPPYDDEMKNLQERINRMTDRSAPGSPSLQDQLRMMNAKSAGSTPMMQGSFQRLHIHDDRQVDGDFLPLSKLSHPDLSCDACAQRVQTMPSPMPRVKRNQRLSLASNWQPDLYSSNNNGSLGDIIMYGDDRHERHVLSLL